MTTRRKPLRARSSIAVGCPLPRPRLQRAAARLPCVLAGFSANLRLSLRPDKGRKAFGNAGDLNKVVGHVDEELKREAEAVFNQARRKEDGLRGAEGGVAMTDRAIAKLDRVAGRDKVLAGIGNGQGNKVVGALAQRRGQRSGHGADQALKIGVGDAGLAPCGIVDAVRRFEHGDLRGNFFRLP